MKSVLIEIENGLMKEYSGVGRGIKRVVIVFDNTGDRDIEINADGSVKKAVKASYEKYIVDDCP